MTDAVHDAVVERLRAAGCVFAEEEAEEIRRVLGHDATAIERAVGARSTGMPLEQVLGRARFAGVEVEVAGGVFVPRARAEAIVTVAAGARPDARIVVDLGCGVGAIAAALAVRMPHAELYAVDVDPAAFRVATANGGVFGFAVHRGDWWAALPARLRGRVELAAVYTPHVPTAELAFIPQDFRDHEPDLAVHGGADGLDPLRAVLAGMGEWMAPGGALVTLVAGEQIETARGLAERVDVVETEDDDAVLVIATAG